MTRLVLCCALCALSVLLALETAILQSKNRERGLALDALKEECDMLEAANSEGCELILSRDWAPLPDLASAEQLQGLGSALRRQFGTAPEPTAQPAAQPTATPSASPGAAGVNPTAQGV